VATTHAPACVSWMRSRSTSRCSTPRSASPGRVSSAIRSSRRVLPRLQPLDRRLLQRGPAAARADRPHLSHGSRRRRRGGPPGAPGRLCGRLPVAGSPRPWRPAVQRSQPRPVLGDRAGPRDAGCLPCRCADRFDAQAMVGRRRKPGRRRDIRLRLPRPRRDAGVHVDDDARPVRDLSPAPPSRVGGRLQLDHCLARSSGPQVRGHAALFVAQAASVRILQEAVRDIRRAGRVAHRPHRRASRRRLRRVGVRLPAPRCVVSRRADHPRAPRRTPGRVAAQGAGRERLRFYGLTP